MSITRQGRSTAEDGPVPATVDAADAGTERRWLWLLLGVAALLHVVTLREGQPWHDDFALYVLHAKNLVEGISYSDTGFIYNPSNAYHSPEVYPPGFPILLAPVYALFGLDLSALRFVVILSAVAMVGVFTMLIRPVLPARAVLAAAALVAFQPFFLRFKNLLLPDFTFVLFVLVSLHLLIRLHGVRDWTRRDLGIALLAGAAIWFTISLRTVGVTLFGAIALHHVLRRRIPTVPVLICVATALALWAAQTALMPPAAGYATQVADAATAVGSSIQAVPVERVTRIFQATDFVRMFVGTDILWVSTGELNAPLDTGLSRVIALVLMFATALLAAFGFLLRLRHLSVIETFVLTYLGVLLLWGAASARYLLPLHVFMFYYAVVALVFLRARGGRVATFGIAGLAGLVAVTYVVNLVQIERGPYAGGVMAPDAVALYDYLDRCTSPEAGFVSHRPRAIALFSGRSATSVQQQELDGAGLISLVEGTDLDGVATERDSRLAEIAASLPGSFAETHSSGRFAVYRYLPSDAVTPGC